MKIALLTDGIFPYVIGGMQKHSFYLAKYFAKNNIHVDLYHTNKSNYDITKLEFFSNDERKNIRSFVIDFPDLGKFPGHYIRESFEYSKIIFDIFKKNSQVNFIYVKGFCGWKLIDEKKNGFKCAPIGINFHGYEMFQQAPSLKSRLGQNLFFRHPVLFNVKNADYVFSYGGKITEIIRKMNIKDKKIIEIPTGIEPNWINKNVKPVEKIRKFVFVGRYERRKGIEEVNEAIKKIIQEADIEMHFIGPIPTSKQIISDKIFYHGEVKDVEKIKLLLCSYDILICPSYSEGMPNVILEAMASGLAIIASDVGAVSLMVSDENGFLISHPATTEKINGTINKMINLKTEVLTYMKQSSVEIVQADFLWDNLIKTTIRYIHSAIDESKTLTNIF